MLNPLILVIKFYSRETIMKILTSILLVGVITFVSFVANAAPPVCTTSVTCALNTPRHNMPIYSYNLPEPMPGSPYNLYYRDLSDCNSRPIPGKGFLTLNKACGLP